VSYWCSKTLDYLSAMNLFSAAAKPLTGLAAEHGPSLFDARHRFVASGSYEVRFANAGSLIRTMFRGWQLNAIASHNSPTPFTVFDSANVALQANSPAISGFAASRPDLAGDPNAGARTPDQWLSRSAFRRLSAVTEAVGSAMPARTSREAPR
jgi:hypothetical protein